MPKMLRQSPRGEPPNSYEKTNQGGKESGQEGQTLIPDSSPQGADSSIEEELARAERLVERKQFKGEDKSRLLDSLHSYLKVKQEEIDESELIEIMKEQMNDGSMVSATSTTVSPAPSYAVKWQFDET